MQVRPNKTIVRGKVQAIRPEPDGWGAEFDLHVESNESLSHDDDFLRPVAGSILKVFSAEPEKIRVGETIVAEASLNAGPTGGRAVLEDFKTVE